MGRQGGYAAILWAAHPPWRPIARTGRSSMRVLRLPYQGIAVKNS
jgi:hypothetical protein